MDFLKWIVTTLVATVSSFFGIPLPVSTPVMEPMVEEYVEVRSLAELDKLESSATSHVIEVPTVESVDVLLKEPRTAAQTSEATNVRQKETGAQVGARTTKTETAHIEVPKNQPSGVTTPAASLSSGAVFTVKKVPEGFSLNMTSEEKTMEISYTTQPLSYDPAKLHVWWTLVDAVGIKQTETDCWPLKTYGTVTNWTNGDLSLAPSPTNTIYKLGHNTVKLLFELIDPTKHTYDPSLRTINFIPIATDDTGFFDLYIPEHCGVAPGC